MRSIYEVKTELRAGDTVAVLAGKDAGKRGTVKSLVAPGRVLVEGINKAKKHQKPRQRMSADAQTPTIEPGGIIDTEMPLAISNVAIVCPKCDRPVRIKAARAADGAKQRLCSRCKGVLPGKATKEVAK
ncbi:MAG: ribosomal protein [Chloroflexota bacterium]|jgi:large subunit ribosomal protein L24